MLLILRNFLPALRRSSRLMFPPSVFAVMAMLGLFIPTASFAGGIVQGAKASGMNGAFIAVADDPSAILHNPAGLTQIQDDSLYIGATFVIPSSSYTAPSGALEETESHVFMPYHMFGVFDFGQEKATFGLGYFSPFGVDGRKWPEDGLTRYGSIESAVSTLTFNPTIAVEILPDLSLAIGLDIMGALSSVELKIDQSAFGATDARQKMQTNGSGMGYDVGILWILGEKVSLGATYLSPVTVEQSGDVEISNIALPLQGDFGGSTFKTGVKTTAHFPDVLGFGVAVRPTKKLTLAFDVEWMGWSKFDQMVFDFEQEAPAAGFTDMTVRYDWRDTWNLKMGMDYRVNKTLSLRTGYAHIQTPVPESTLTPSNPDSDQHNLSVGFGYHLGGGAVVDGFYNISMFEDREVNNSILSGTYENLNHYIGFSFGHPF